MNGAIWRVLVNKRLPRGLESLYIYVRALFRFLDLTWTTDWLDSVFLLYDENAELVRILMFKLV